MSNPLTDLFASIKEQKQAHAEPGKLIIVGAPVQMVEEVVLQPVAQAPAREYVTPEIHVHVVPRNDPNESIARIDHDANVINAYFDEYAIDISFNEAYYKDLIWQNRVPSTSTDGLFSYTIGTHLIPTCSSYAPSSTSIAANSIPHPDYPYYNAVPTPVCLNTERALMHTWNRTIHDVCPHRVQYTCDKYSGYSWVETHVAYVGETTFRLQKNYLGDRKLTYRVISETGDETTIVFSSQMNSAEDYDSIFEQFKNFIGDAEICETNQDFHQDEDAVPVNFLSKLVSVEA